MLTTNAADLRLKSKSLKNIITHFKSAIFSVQETHFRRKGRFRMKDYHIFESIRKNKEQGGTLLGVQVGLKPVLIKEYNDTFELLVVEVIVANKNIRLITGYGPQENWDINERTPFYTALEEEIAAAELQGRSIIITMDANAKLGPDFIAEDPYNQSPNGKLLAGLVSRHALCVVNGLTEKKERLNHKTKEHSVRCSKKYNRFCDSQ